VPRGGERVCGVLLDTIPPGTHAIVERVPDGAPALLQYLQSLGLVLGASIRVEDIAPFGDVLTVRIGEATHAVGGSVARRVLVTLPADGEER